MVLVRHNARHWRKRLACGGVGLAIALALQAARSQPVPERTHEPPRQNDNSSDYTARAPTPAQSIRIVQVEPSAQEIDKIAKQQADESRIFWLQPDDWVAIFTAILSLSTGLLWVETRRVGKGAEESTISHLRPWVSATVEPASDIIVQDDGFWFFAVKITLKNFGSSPAHDIRVLTAIAQDENAAIDIQKEMKVLISDGGADIKRTIFPGVDINYVQQVNTWRFSKNNKFGFQVRKNPTDNNRFLCGIVQYKFLNGNIGETFFNFMVAQKPATHRIIFDVGYGIDPAAKNVKKDDIVLYPFGKRNDST